MTHRFRCLETCDRFALTYIVYACSMEGLFDEHLPVFSVSEIVT